MYANSTSTSNKSGHDRNCTYTELIHKFLRLTRLLLRHMTISIAYEIRTRVTALKGQRPGPLDECDDYLLIMDHG